MRLIITKKIKSVAIICLIALVAFTACDKDDVTTPKGIDMKIEGVSEGVSIMKGSVISIKVSIEDTETFDMISILLDGRLIESFTEFPIEYSWNTSEVELGEYPLQFIAYKEFNEVGTKEFKIQITAPLTVTDYDGNVYHTVQIGTQIWMVENLKTTHYRNGDGIATMGDMEEWSLYKQGAYCDYNNEKSYVNPYGHLYNYFAIEDSRGLCPEGWHVPTREEYHTLIEYLGGRYEAPNKLKEAGSEHWSSTLLTTENEGTNESGFTALPGGVLTASGQYSSLGYMAYFWTSEGYTSDMSGNPYGYAQVMSLSNSVFEYNNYHAYMGMSIRCIKD